MGQLFLSGGGNASQTNVINKMFAESLKADGPVLVIPIAGDPSRRSYEDSFRYIEEVFQMVGIADVVMWTDVHNKTLEDLEPFSAVYLSGGDPFKLMKELLKTSFTHVLQQFYHNGGVIYGQSAGAIVLGEGLMHLLDKGTTNDPVDGVVGMRLLPGYQISCHYTSEDRHRVQRLSHQTGRPIVAMPEGTAVHYNGNEMTSLGTGKAWIFDDDTNKEII